MATANNNKAIVGPTTSTVDHADHLVSHVKAAARAVSDVRLVLSPTDLRDVHDLRVAKPARSLSAVAAATTRRELAAVVVTTEAAATVTTEAATVAVKAATVVANDDAETTPSRTDVNSIVTRLRTRRKPRPDTSLNITHNPCQYFLIFYIILFVLKAASRLLTRRTAPERATGERPKTT